VHPFSRFTSSLGLPLSGELHDTTRTTRGESIHPLLKRRGSSEKHKHLVSVHIRPNREGCVHHCNAAMGSKNGSWALMGHMVAPGFCGDVGADLNEKLARVDVPVQGSVM